MYTKWKGNTIQARATIAEAFRFNESATNPLIIESNVLMDIYDGNYESAISYLSSKNIQFISVQFYVNLKSLLLARVYSLKNMPEKAHEYYDSARISLESKILENPQDSRLYSAVGIAYAGLGQKEMAIEAGKRGVDLMPISIEAYRGVFRAEDLARIYVMVGKYDAALEQIKLLLNIPSRLSVKLLMLDPDWKPLWNLPEFKKLTGTPSPA
jgi:tetratricopeptide (TPR) repeat protein